MLVSSVLRYEADTVNTKRENRRKRIEDVDVDVCDDCWRVKR